MDIIKKDKMPALVVKEYIQAATSHNTRKAYVSDVRHYESAGGKLPATPEMLLDYLHRFAEQLNPRTLSRRLVAIRHWHTYQGFPDPVSHPAIKKMLRGIMRLHGKPKVKALALLPDDIARLHQYLSSQSSLSAQRDDAMIQLGYFGAMRRSELVNVHYEHITWNKAGIEILLPASKTDQLREGQICILPYGNQTLCPILALKNWLDSAGIKTGPVFCRIYPNDEIAKTALTPLSVNQILKKRAAEAGFADTRLISSHSLRRGLATSAAQTGARLETIMRAGRWKQTNTVMEYIDAQDQYTNHAAFSILQSIQNKT